jgi:hypothetical protein
VPSPSTLSPPHRSKQILPRDVDWQLPQHWASLVQGVLLCWKHRPGLPVEGPQQLPPQQSVSAEQVPPFGWHIGVVEVEVVLVVVEVVLVEVLVVLLVDVLVEVVVVVPHGPSLSPCPRCAPRALSGTLKRLV